MRFRAILTENDLRLIKAALMQISVLPDGCTTESVKELTRRCDGGLVLLRALEADQVKKLESLEGDQVFKTEIE